MIKFIVINNVKFIRDNVVISESKGNIIEYETMEEYRRSLNCCIEDSYEIYVDGILLENRKKIELTLIPLAEWRERKINEILDL